MIQALVGFFGTAMVLPSWLVMTLVSMLLLIARRRKMVYVPFLVYFASGAGLTGLYWFLIHGLPTVIIPVPLVRMSYVAFMHALLAFCVRAGLGVPYKTWLIKTQFVAGLVLLSPVFVSILGILDWWTIGFAERVFWSACLLLALVYWVAVFRVRAGRRARAFTLVFLSVPTVLPLLFLSLPSGVFGPVGELLPDWLAFLYFIPVFGMFSLSLDELRRGDRNELALDANIARLTNSVQRFIPVEFLHQLSKQTLSELQLGDHIKKDMTIFFSDIRAFTELSEVLTPEENFAFINSYFSRMVPLIRGNGGFVDKYMGDGIMALFPSENGADDALRSAVQMQLKVNEYNGHRAKTGYRSISLGVGLHTGTLMLGVVGVNEHMEGTVVSDAVNLSSRLQSIAKAFNLATVISEATFMALNSPGEYKYRFIGKVRVKGKNAPVSVFEIFDGLQPDLFERKMGSNRFFEQGMIAYYQKEFADAVFYFKRAMEAVPEDGAARFYLEICLRKSMAK